ncbi:hypothetical protein ACP70R_029024 [Stipagrostis hirtigluma subsp. patula]
MGEEEVSEVELEVAAILCDLKRILRARDRRRRRRLQREREAAPEIPSWGRRRLRSVLEDSKPAAPAAAEAVAERERDGAASPDTPLAFPESDAAEEDDDAKKAARTHAEWVQQQQGVVASLSQENAHLVKQIEEYRARLQSSRSANESLKQLHKVRQIREQEQKLAQARPALDLNAPAPEDASRVVAAAAEEWYRRGQALQRAAVQRAAATAEARRRRLEILRAKAGSPLLSCRTRRVAGASTAGSGRG